MKGFNLSAFALRERAITLYLIILVVIAGTFSYMKLGRAEDPVFSVKVMTVTLIWPGATADEIQRQAGDRLEKRLQELAFYDRVETESRPGVETMKIFLQDYTLTSQLPEEFYQTRKKLMDEAVNLPRGVIGPIFNDEYSDVYFALYTLDARDLPHRKLVLQAEDIREQLLHVSGVLKVNILGEQPQQIFVEVPYKRLATLGITSQDFFSALAKQNDVTPAGFLDTQGPRLYLRLDGAIDDVDVVRNIPITAGNRTLKIGDIADVHRGYADPPTAVIRSQGERSLVLGVVMRPGYNGLVLGEALKGEEANLRAALPLGMSINKIVDQAAVISAAIFEFMEKFFTALTVVIVVSLLSLGFRVGLVVAAAIPLTLCIVFFIMMMTGRDFDRITLGALIISLGLLVDDAIISIEMMVVKMEEGLDRIAAATFAWHSTAAPMLTGTLVTIAGFMPIGFAHSAVGEYAGNIFWVTSFSLISSWFVAVYFIPYLGVKLLPDLKKKTASQLSAPKEQGIARRAVRACVDGVAAKHEDAAVCGSKNYRRLRRVIRACVDNKWMVVGIVAATFALAVAGMGSLAQQFFPTSDRHEVMIEVNLPDGSAIGATEQIVEHIEAVVSQQAEAKIVTSYVGEGEPRFNLSLDPLLPDPAFAKVIIQTQDAEHREILIGKLRAIVAMGRFPGARVRITQIVFGPPVRFHVGFRVLGIDLDRVRQFAEQARAIVAADPGVTDIHLDYGNKVPTLHFVLDQERLRLIGLTPKDAGDQLQVLLTGTSATQVRENLRSVDVLVRSPGVERRRIVDVSDLTLTTKTGASVPLSQVGRVETRMEQPVLKRYDRRTYITVEGDAVGNNQPPDITVRVWPKLQAFSATMPPGYSIDLAGDVEESVKASRSLAEVFPIMLLTTFTILMLQTRSFSTMFMVALTAPLGLVGAVPALLFFHKPFGFTAILGLIGLSGILMRNTLILADQIHQDIADGKSQYEAIVEATVRRARPVILTALAAMLAFIPLTQSIFWSALAYVLIAGVGAGTCLTILFLPALYAVWFRVKRRPAEQAETAYNPSQAAAAHG